VSRLRFVAGIVTLSGIALLTACNSTAIGPREAAAPKPDVNLILPLDGKKIFENYCATCHGTRGEGDGPAAAALRNKVPQLNTLGRRNGGSFPTDQVVKMIAGDASVTAHGSREMPVWGPIFHQIEYDQDLGYIRLQNVTEYLKTLQQK
jgi:mono/diheme cytochrome c family protein